MKKFAVAALSLGLLGALPAAQAASISVDAGAYVLSYDDTFLTGATVNASSGVVTFSGLTYQASASGAGSQVGSTMGSFNSYGLPYPIIITPKAGYQIAYLLESVAGNFSASAASEAGAQAGAVAGYVSRWVKLDGADILGQNVQYQYLAGLLSGQSSAGSYTVSGGLNIADADSAPGAIALSALDLVLGAGAVGGQSVAQVSMHQYQLGVQVTTVPEPESIALALAGIGVLGTVRRRKQA